MMFRKRSFVVITTAVALGASGVFAETESRIGPEPAPTLQCEAMERNIASDGQVIAKNENVLCKGGTCIEVVANPWYPGVDDSKPGFYDAFSDYIRQENELLSCKTAQCDAMNLETTQMLISKQYQMPTK